MTLKEYMKMVKPEMVSNQNVGGVAGCPACYPFLNAPDMCADHPAHYADCNICWNRQYVHDRKKEADKCSQKS